jgi:hypothetical protein
LVVCAVAELAVRVGVEVEMEEYREEMLEKVEEEATHLRVLDLTPRVEHWLMVVEVRRRRRGDGEPIGPVSKPFNSVDACTFELF